MIRQKYVKFNHNSIKFPEEAIDPLLMEHLLGRREDSYFWELVS